MIVYISLPIETKGFNFINQWRVAKKIQRLLESDGNMVVNPFDLAYSLEKEHDRLKKLPPTRRDYLDYDIKHVRMCTHIFLCNGWQDSSGCIEEVEEATLRNVKPIFESDYERLYNKNFQ